MTGAERNMARLRAAPSAPAAKTTANKAEPAKATRDTRANAPTYSDDGQTEDLVKDAPKRRGRQLKSARNEEGAVMAGGLAPNSQDAAEARTTNQLSEETGLQAEVPSTDELSKGDTAAAPATRPQRRGRMARKPVQSEAQSRVLDGLRRRMEATAAVSSPNVVPSSDSLPTKPAPARQSTGSQSRVERSEFSISPSPPPAGKLHSVTGARTSIAAPSSALRPQNTPHIESSILALKNFKRRARQPSLLQMVQQHTQEREAEDPSIYDVEDGSSEADDFAPEAEGTPMQVIKAPSRKSSSSKKPQPAKLKVAEKETVAANGKKRKSDDIASASTDALRAKKRQSVAPAPQSAEVRPASNARTRRRIPPSPQVRLATPDVQLTSEVQVIGSSVEPSSTPPTEPSSSAEHLPPAEEEAVVPSTEPYEEPQDEHMLLNDIEPDEPARVPNSTMADPLSSSPLPTEPTRLPLSPLPANVRRGRTASEKPGKRQKAMTTSTLTALLPKRRQPLKPRPRKSEYHITSDSDEDATLDASHLAEDEDELSGHLRRQTKATSRKFSRATTKTRKSTLPAKKATAPAKKPGRTYGRAKPTPDKENEYQDDADEEGETSVSTYKTVKSRELEDVARKFAEIDQFDMAFESFSGEGHRTSSQEWR